MNLKALIALLFRRVHERIIWKRCSSTCMLVYLEGSIRMKAYRVDMKNKHGTGGKVERGLEARAPLSSSLGGCRSEIL